MFKYKAGLLKGKKTQESTKKLKARVAMLELKTDNCHNESLFTKKSKSSNRDNPVLDRNGNSTR